MAVGQFYFAWSDQEEEFNPSTHNREDEDVFAFRYSHSEGDFAQIEFDIRNPRVGLLNVGRKLWVWFSVETAGGITPLFYGRIVGIPSNLFEEIVTITCIARPFDYVDQKMLLAEDLKVAPFYDPIFILPDRVDDPDTVLEGYGALWHSDPVTHEVTTSSVTEGEDGTISLTADQYLSDDMALRLGQSPATKVVVTGSVNWTQELTSAKRGHVDLAAVLPLNLNHLISTFTLQGLISSWPKVGQVFGDYVTFQSELEDVSFTAFPPISIPFWFTDEAPDRYAQSPPTVRMPKDSIIFMPLSAHLGAEAASALDLYGDAHETTYALCGWGKPTLKLGYNVTRKYSESYTITVSTSVQPIVTEPNEDDVITLSINSNDLSEEIAGEVPIGELDNRTFFDRDRGKEAIKYLLCCARAALLMKSRAVEIDFLLPFLDAVALEVTLRKNVQILNPRLPGGQATGKVIGIEHALDGDAGLALSKVTIGCTIGKGEGPYSPAPGDPVYGEIEYMGGDYQQMTNKVEVISSEVKDLAFTVDPYSPLDDGLGAGGIVTFGRNPLVKAVELLNPASDQAAAVQDASDTIVDQSGLEAVLRENFTQLTFALQKLSVGPFETPVNVTVDDLVIPMQINLEA